MINFQQIKQITEATQRVRFDVVRDLPAEPAMQNLREINYSRKTLQLDSAIADNMGINDDAAEMALVIKHGLRSENQGVIDAFRRFYMLAKLSIPSDDEDYSEIKQLVAEIKRQNDQITSDNKFKLETYKKACKQMQDNRYSNMKDLVDLWNGFLDTIEEIFKPITKNKKNHTDLQKAIISIFENNIENLSVELKGSWWYKFDKTPFVVVMSKNSTNVKLNELSNTEKAITTIVDSIRFEVQRHFQLIYEKLILDQVFMYDEDIAFLLHKKAQIDRMIKDLSRAQDRKFHAYTYYKHFDRFDRYDPYDARTSTHRSWIDDEIEQTERDIAELENKAFVYAQNLVDRVDPSVREHMVFKWFEHFKSVEDLKFIPNYFGQNIMRNLERLQTRNCE